MSQPETLLSSPIPAPTGGWNARDPIQPYDPATGLGMKAHFALRMINIFPRNADIGLRRGFRTHATGVGSGAVQTLFEYSKADGTRDLLAAGGGKIYEATTFDTPAVQIGTGFSINRWQGVNYRDTAILVNGTDQPQQWDGTTLSAANYTGIADDALLISVTSYKSRLYFLKKNGWLWYGLPEEITGALTEFNPASFLRRGGYAMFAGSWTGLFQDTSTDVFVIITNMGEVLAYAGESPADWALVGHYFMPIPLGRRAFLPIGADMVILTEDGGVPLSAVFQGGNALGGFTTVTDNIRNAYNAAVYDYKTNAPWEAISYPRGRMLLLNIPTVTDTSSEQYVMNSETGAWCRFTGWNACSFGLLNEKLYFGGTDGKVYEGDFGEKDGTASIPTKLKQAFNYLGDSSAIKMAHLVQPIFRAETALDFLYDVDVDFSDKMITDTVSTVGASGSEWDTAEWDVADWAGSDIYTSDTFSVAGIGRCFALRLEGSFQDTMWNLSGTNFMYEPGGLL